MNRVLKKEKGEKIAIKSLRPHFLELTNIFLKYWYLTHDKTGKESDTIQFWHESTQFIKKMLKKLGIETTQ